MKYLIAAILFVASSAWAQLPYVTAATNAPVDTYVLGRSGASGGHNLWVPYANLTNSSTNTIILRPGAGITVATNLPSGRDFTVGSMWSTNAADGSITNISANRTIGIGSVAIGAQSGPGTALITSDNLTNSGTLFFGRSNSVNVFQVDNTGNLKLIKGVSYTWPSTNGTTGQVLASTSGGLLYWTNSTSSPFVAAGTNITLVTNGPVVTINGNPSDLWTNDLDGSIRILRPVDQTRMAEVFHIGTNNFAIEGLIQNTNAANQTAAGYFENLGTNSNPPVSLIGGNGGSFGVLGENAGNNGFGLTNGEGIGVQGLADSGFKRQFGVQGVARAQYNVQTNVGGAFSASSNGKTGTTNTGLYVETQSGSAIQSNYVSSVAQLNSLDGSPLIVGQSNNQQSILVRSDGSLFLGKDAPLFGDIPDFSTAFLQQVSNVDSNGPTQVYWELESTGANGGFYGQQTYVTLADKDSASSSWDIQSAITNGNSRRLRLQMIPSGTSQFSYTSNSVPAFGFDDSGDLVTIKTIGYHWPTTNGTAGKVLATSGGSPQQLYWTNQSAGGGGGSGVGPGTAKRVSMFDSTTTNVTDSSEINIATNEIDFRMTNASYSSTVSNVMYGAYTNATAWRATAISVDPIGYTRIDQLLGSAVTPLSTYPRNGLIFNAAWLINGYGSSATGDGGGKVPDLLPIIDNAFSIGSTSSHVKAVTTGTGGLVMPDGGTVQSSGMSAAWDSSFWYLTYKPGPAIIMGVFYNGGLPVTEMGNGGWFGISSGAISSTGTDTWIGRNLNQSGHYWTTETNNGVASGIGGANGSGTDKTGGDFVIYGGQSTGTGDGGDIIGKTTPKAASTSSSANSLQERFHVSSSAVTLTTNSATTICTFTVPTSLTVVGGKFSATTEIKDATDIAVVTEEFRFSAVNKAGTVTASISVPSSINGTSTGSAGVTTTWTVTVSSTTVSIKCNAVTTGINSTTSRVLGPRIELDSDGTSIVAFQ